MEAVGVLVLSVYKEQFVSVHKYLQNRFCETSIEARFCCMTEGHKYSVNFRLQDNHIFKISEFKLFGLDCTTQ